MSTLSRYDRRIEMPLASLRGRLKRLACACGALRLLVRVIALLSLAGLLDYLLHLPAASRVVLLAGLAIYAARSLWVWIAAPLLRPIPLDSLAARVDALHPAYQDRVRSGLRFLAAGNDDGASTQMQQQVVQQAATVLQQAPLDEVLDRRPLWKMLKWTGVAVAAAALLTLWEPSLCRLAMLRLFTPLSAPQWPRQVKIELLSPVPARVPIGQRVDFAVRLARGDKADRQVLLNWRLGSSPLQRQLMQRDAQGHYLAGLDARPGGDARASSLEAWIEAGDEELNLPRIELVPRLAVVDAQLRVTPPAYTGLPAEDVPLLSRQVTVWAGSMVRATFSCNKPVSADFPPALEPAGSEKEAAAPSPAWNTSDPAHVAATWRADASTRFRLRAKDVSGFENAGTEEYSVIVRPDQSPVVQIETPRRGEERTATATVPLAAVAEDDLAVQTVTLRAALMPPAGSTTATQPAAAAPSMLLVNEKGAAAPAVAWTALAPAADRRRYSLAYPWQLAHFPTLGLKPGDVIEFYLEATDSYRMGERTHAPALSQKLRITIISEQDLLERVSGDLRGVAAQIVEARKLQDRLIADTEQLAADTRGKPEFQPADRQVADRIAEQQLRLSSQTSELAARLGDISRRLDENGVQQPQMKEATAAAKQLLGDAAATPMPGAARQLKEASSVAAAAREQAFQKSGEAQKQSAEALKHAADRLGDFGGLQQMLDRVRDLLDEQRRVSTASAEASRKTLGKTPDQLTPEERQALESVARKQDDLSQRSSDAMEALKAMADRLQQSDPASAQAMRDAASTGQAQSVSQHQQAAASALRGNQQSQSQSSQQNAELGLEMMLAGLRDAERRKLEELVRKLAELREQVEQLRRRQASHNLDSLLIQDAARTLAGASTRPVKDLLERSQRTADSLQSEPAPELRQLAASQQQTHLNTSDLAGGTGSVKGADEVAALLNKAAGRMERAMVLLRAQKVHEAYDPPQVEALAQLDAALQKVEQLRQQSEAQARKRQQEEVRQVLIAIQKDQTEVAAQTQRLDKALAGEQKHRADRLKLAQTAGEQGKLAQRMSQVETDLANLGSVVFVSVAQEAKGDMDLARQSMEKGSAGPEVQQKHMRILSRLDAMIRALKEEEPKPERFAERSSGGSGGGGGASQRRLPPGAEMKLLRELQAIINGETRVADAARASAPALDDLADRQKGVRSLLDEMLKKASGGKLSLGEEKAGASVPEENQDAVDELDQELLTGKPGSEGDPQPLLDSLSQRMTRSRIRLAEAHDPGSVTQKIQEKILKSLDDLLQKSQQEQQQQSSSSQGEGAGKLRPGGGGGGPGANRQTGRGSEAAKESKLSPGAKSPDASVGDIRQSAKEWGGLSARDRQAVIDSAGEDVVEKYRALVEDYYRSLSERATTERR